MKAKTFLKLLVSVVMLLVVLRLVDLGTLKNTISSISIWWAALVVVGYTMGQFLSSFKWWLIATSSDLKVPYSHALKAYFIGMYVNNFGFGMVGGDVARGVLIAHGVEHGGKPARSIGLASVVADRAHGLAVLALIGTITMLIVGRQNLEPTFFYMLGLLSVGIVVGWFFGPSILLRFIPPSSKWRKKIEMVTQVFPKNPQRILLITFVSLVFHLWQITLHWIMGMSLGISIPWSTLLVSIPFVNIASSIPIGWNGLGIRENAYVFFLVPAALPSNSEAFAFGAMWFLAVTVSSAIGGIFAFVSKDLKIVEEDEKLVMAEQAQPAGK